MVKSRWALVGIFALLGLFSGALGYIFGSVPRNLGTAYLDWSELGAKLPLYKVYANPADEKMADIAMDIDTGADIARYTTSALQALSDAEEACEGLQKKPEKVRITVSSGYMRRMFTFRLGNFAKLKKGEMGTKEFWIDAFELGVPTEAMSSTQGRKSKFEDAFAALDDSDVQISTETVAIKMKGERADWAGDTAKTCARLYTAQKSTGLYIQTVVITCPTREGAVTVKFNYKYFLDMMTGKLPASEFQKRVYVEVN